eukprot:768520-Hanusia_phi.AAC.7
MSYCPLDIGILPSVVMSSLFPDFLEQMLCQIFSSASLPTILLVSSPSNVPSSSPLPSPPLEHCRESSAELGQHPFPDSSQLISPRGRAEHRGRGSTQGVGLLRNSWGGSIHPVQYDPPMCADA